MAKEYIVLSRQDATAKNGSSFVSLRVANMEESFTLCVWDVQRTDALSVGQLVKFTHVSDDNGRRSARRNEMVIGTFPQEDHPLYHLIPRPVKREVWDECIEHLVGFCTDEQLKAFIIENAAHLYSQYDKKPAATNVHHAYPGGLLNHTYQMLHLLEGLYPVYPYIDEIKVERIIIGALFHDYGKCYEYNGDGQSNENRYLLGHIYISSNYLNQQLAKAGIAAVERTFIVHTVLSHHGELEFGSPVKPCTPEAQLVHFLDDISAKADVFHSTGNMEKSFSLGTTVVKG